MKLALEALRTLPKSYIQEDTKFTEYGLNLVYAANPKLPAIVWSAKTKRWSKVPFNPGAYKMHIRRTL